FAVEIAPGPDHIEILQSKTDRVHDFVAACAWLDFPVQFEPLPQRCHLHLLWIFLQIGINARWWNGCRRSKDVFQNPSSARHRRRSSSDRTNRQKTALAQYATARTRCVQSHTTEVTTMDVRNAIVLSKPFVDKRVIGIEQIDDTAILTNNALEEHLGFPPERLPEIVVEILRGSLHFSEFPQTKPLSGKVTDQCLRLRIG